MLDKAKSQFGGWRWLWISLLVMIIDQASKNWANINLYFGAPREITSFFNLNLAYNSGAAFSMLDSLGGLGTIILALISLLMIAFILIWLKRTPSNHKLLCIGLALVEGGAVGNLIDRLSRGFVVDFFGFHIKDWHFAYFNVADSAICIGVGLILLHMIINRQEDSKEDNNENSSS